MNNNELPIFRSALELAVYIETIVKGFDKYYKYTIDEAKAIVFEVLSDMMALASLKRSIDV